MRVWIVSESHTYRVEADTAEEAVESIHRGRLLDSNYVTEEEL